ncbi:unnamed protein product [Prunus armeniaca]|uniref:N-acetyltransferase domain-containing protein n=1 Tax=Prunus armeniaca TaxID=36596 RepID=A0A6J5WJ22_PRUAR|nr:unnamed protein product [Prunus armeniaca]
MEISAAAATAAAAAMPMHVVEGHTTKKTMELKWMTSVTFSSRATSHATVSPNYVDAGGGRCVVEAVDLHKLRVALSHSSVLVSVFCKPNDVIGCSSSSSSCLKEKQQQQQKKKIVGFGELLQNVVMPVTPLNSQLVGFGRAVSDLGLTASIYDVMVLPSLRGMGIGRMIVKRIIRMLTSRDIYDIAALCSENERSFFEVCGFGDDILGSTAMMYTRSSVSTNPQDNQIVKPAGRKLLLVPPLSKTSPYSKTMKS